MNRFPGLSLTLMKLIGLAAWMISALILIEAEPIGLKHPEQQGAYAVHIACLFAGVALGRRKRYSWWYVLGIPIILYVVGDSGLVFHKAFWHAMTSRVPAYIPLMWVIAAFGGIAVGYSQRISDQRKAMTTSMLGVGPKETDR